MTTFSRSLIQCLYKITIKVQVYLYEFINRHKYLRVKNTSYNMSMTYIFSLFAQVFHDIAYENNRLKLIWKHISLYNLQIFASPDPNTGLFKQCATDIFAVHADCIGKICNMHFVSVGRDGWIPETAIVYHRDYPPITFNFDSFLPSGGPFGVNYCEHY